MSTAEVQFYILRLAADLDRRRNERRNRRRFSVHLRNSVDPFTSLSEVEFVKTFRLSKNVAMELADDLASFIPRERRSDGLSVRMKVGFLLVF